MFQKNSTALTAQARPLPITLNFVQEGRSLLDLLHDRFDLLHELKKLAVIADNLLIHLDELETIYNPLAPIFDGDQRPGSVLEEMAIAASEYIETYTQLELIQSEMTSKLRLIGSVETKIKVMSKGAIIL